MDANILKGKKMLIIAISFVLGISIISIVIFLFSLGTEKLLEQTVRLALTALLCYFVYNGYSWAKWVMVVLLSISAFIGLLGTITIVVSPVLGIVSFVYFAVYAEVVYIIAIQKDAKAFMKYQKENRTKVN